MGNWTMHIEGTGPHHNDKEYDAEKMGEEFVKKLQRFHTVQSASITMSGRQSIMPKPEVEQNEES